MVALYEVPSVDKSVSTKCGTLKNSSLQIKISPNFLREHPLKFTLVCSPANSLVYVLCFDDYYTTSMSMRTGRYSWRNSQVSRFCQSYSVWGSRVSACACHGDWWPLNGWSSYSPIC